MGIPMRSTPPDLALGSGRRELERQTVEFIGYRLGETEAREQPIGASCRGGTGFEKVAARPPRASETQVLHDVSLSLALFRTDHGVL